MAGPVGLAARAIATAAGKALKKYARGSGTRKADSLEKAQARELESIRSYMNSTSKRAVKEREEATKRVAEAVSRAVK